MSEDTDREADDLLEALDPDRGAPSFRDLVLRRVRGTFVVDEWGFDPDLVAALAPLAHLRWSLSVDGAEYLPEIGAALVVTNQRHEPLSALLTAVALRAVTHRPVRFSGVPDVVPVAPALRRLGGVPDDLDDLRSLLHAGEVVVRSFRGSLVDVAGLGDPETDALGVALALGVPVVPVHLSGTVVGRRRRLLVGAPIVTRRRTRPVARRGWPDAHVGSAAAAAASADGLAETLRRRMAQLADAP